MAKHSKEQIILALQNLSETLGKKNLSKSEITQIIPPSVLRYHFGSIGQALEEAGLERYDLLEASRMRGEKMRIPDDDLFRALFKAESKTGHEPKYNECSAHGEFSARPYVKRFGKWREVIAHYRKWKSENAVAAPDQTAVSLSGGARHDAVSSQDIQSPVSPVIEIAKRKAPEQFYGEPIDFRGLRHAPINEQGVVFLFAIISRELGFTIESIQQGFPDCEGKYLYDRKTNRWAKARIEFEYRASSFREHGHDVAQCDFIVCWINDWPDCPVTVIELQSEIRKLPSR